MLRTANLRWKIFSDDIHLANRCMANGSLLTESMGT